MEIIKHNHVTELQPKNLVDIVHDKNSWIVTEPFWASDIPNANKVLYSTPDKNYLFWEGYNYQVNVIEKTIGMVRYPILNYDYKFQWAWLSEVPKLKDILHPFIKAGYVLEPLYLG